MWFNAYSPMLLKPLRILALKTTSTHVACVPRFTCYRQDDNHLDEGFTSVPVYDDAALSSDGYAQGTVSDKEIVTVPQTLAEGTPDPKNLRTRSSISATRFAATKVINLHVLVL
jgi:hypothetical protein